MWLSTMMSVGRPLVCLWFSNARSSIATSFASPTRSTAQPYPRNRVATSSEQASDVLPSIVILLLS